MDEAGTSTEEDAERERWRRTTTIRASWALLRCTACLLQLRAAGAPRSELLDVHLMLCEFRRIRSASPLDDRQLFARTQVTIFSGLQSVQTLVEQMESLPSDAKQGEIVSIATEHSRSRIPAEDQIQVFLESRQAQRKAWWEQQRRQLEVTLALAEAVPQTWEAPDDSFLPVPPPAEMLAMLEAALALFTPEWSRYEDGCGPLARLRENAGPIKHQPRVRPIGPMLERSRNILATALFNRCEEILLAQKPELSSEVRTAFESLAAFRICRATEPQDEKTEPELPMTPEQIVADLERGFAEIDRRFGQWAERQQALLTSSLKQARHLVAAATRGN